jgi:hypothetical protein
VVALHLVKLACELPDTADRSLSLWTCAELARTLRRDGIVESISPQSVQRILESQKLKPWRVRYWLSPKVPRDTAFRQTAPKAKVAALYLVGTVQGQRGFFRSTDSGATGVRINDDQHQWGLVLHITGDPKKFGRVYVETHGRGTSYGDPAGK